jgi:hypothetical protein
MSRTTIYVRLLDEKVDVWRPVEARPVGQNECVILGRDSDPEIERWEFRPGDRVVCGLADLSGGKVLTAVRLAGATSGQAEASPYR